jgi:hypothetical protein
MTTHVEFLPNVMVFCGLRAPEVPREDAVILARDWFGAVERLQIADCPACLLKLHMIGDSATIKITRMGMKVDVHDVDENALTEN